MQDNDNQTGLLLVGHGTTSDVGTGQFLALADRIAEGVAPVPVAPAFLEMREPDIDAAVDRLLGRGINRLVTMPLLLFAAGHAKRDIPHQASAALARRGQSHIEQVQAAHLGCHPALIELSRLRTEQAETLVPRLPPGNALAGGSRLREFARSAPQPVGRGRASRSRGPGVDPGTKEDGTEVTDTCLLLVGRGSHDQSAIAEMLEFARLRQVAWKRAACEAAAVPSTNYKLEVAFLAMARPLLPQQLSKVGALSYRRVIVQPHLLFYGELVEMVERQVVEAAVCHPQTDWMVAPPLVDRAGIVTRTTDLIQKVITDRCFEAGIRVVAPR